tara:strand:- start:457 stop:1203 length:747 start_codon:yes stop_codon:yes gene_type:complete
MADITFKEYLEGRSRQERMEGRQKLMDDFKEFKRRQKVLEQKTMAKSGKMMGGPSLKALGTAAGARLESAKDRIKKQKEKSKAKPKSPAKGEMKKPTGPKPGSMDYFLQETMKPGYKMPKMDKGGVFSGDKKTLTRIERVRKAKGFRPGETPAQFNQRKALEKRAMEAAKATKIGRIVLPIAVAGVAAQQFLKSKMKKNEQKAKPKKKMGGGLTEATRKLKAQGMVSGGAVCRGMGAALRGGNFKGVK